MTHVERRFTFNLTLSFLLAVTALGGAVAAEQEGETTDLTRLLEEYRNLRLAEGAVAATGQTMKIGHLELTFEEGQLVPLQSAGGHPMGFVFEGFGRYVYRTDDPSDQQVLESNLEAISKAPIYKDHTLSDTIDRMLLFFARPDFEEVWNPEGGRVPVTDEATRGFEKIWKRIEKTYLEYDHFAAEARLNGGDRQYVFAEIEGGKETVGYSYNDVRSNRERMFLFRKLSGFDLRFQQRVSTQTIDTGEEHVPPTVVLRHADFDISTDDNRTGRISSALRFEAARDDVRVVALLLMNHRDPNNYDWRSDRNEYKLLSVTDVEGNALPFSHRYHEVLVQLPEPVSKGSMFEVHFKTEGEVLTGMSGERHDNYFELFSDNWFPEPFGWRAIDHTFTLKARTRKPYRPVASGTLMAFREEGDYYELEAASSRPVEYLGFFAGKYKTNEQTFGDRTIRIHGYATARKQVLENMPKLANAFIEFYEQTLRPYPLKELDIVEVPEYGFGIAPPGMVLLTTEAYKPYQTFLAEYFSRGINARLAHEIAHQWFGHMANPAFSEDSWISESLAEYMSGMAMAAMARGKKRVMGFDQMLDEWQRYAMESRDAGPLTAANILSGPDARRNRHYLLYCRGPLIMRMLHSTVGNERFYGILRRFLENADMGYATTDDFRKAAEQVLRAEMSWFVEDWIRAGGVPEINVAYDVSSSGGKAKLSGTARVEEGSSYKRLIIPLVLDFGAGQRSILAVDFDQPEKQFSFDLPGKPKSVKVDPAGNCLAKFN